MSLCSFPNFAFTLPTLTLPSFSFGLPSFTFALPSLFCPLD